MIYEGIEICCPSCHGDLVGKEQQDSLITCCACRKEFPVIQGIPDLRVFPDPYIDFDQDRQKGEKVASRFHELDFQGLIEYYYSLTSVVPPEHARLYSRGLMAGQARAETTFHNWTKLLDEKDTREFQNVPALEIGCGTAPFLVVASRAFSKIIGIDIAFRWLILGKKRLEEAGVHVPLICACAEALPFPRETFGVVVSESTIEHLRDQPSALSEVGRVLTPQGLLCITTPNKLSLGPDPHAGIWLGGIIPESWIARYVKMKGGIPPKRQLLSVSGLKHLLRNAGFHDLKLGLPDVSENQRKYFSKALQIIIDVYRISTKVALTRWFLYKIGPLFLAVARKSSLSNMNP